MPERRVRVASAENWAERLNGYGALLVTVFIFALLSMAMGISAWSADKQTFGNLVETVKSLAMVAGGFWLRSLSGPKKDDTIASLGSALAISSPPTPVVTTTTTAAGDPGASTTTRTATGSAAEAPAPLAPGAGEPSPDPEIEDLRRR